MLQQLPTTKNYPKSPPKKINFNFNQPGVFQHHNPPNTFSTKEINLSFLFLSISFDSAHTHTQTHL